MGCCCNKEKNEEEDERTRLLNSDHSQIKSRFVEQTRDQTQTNSRNLNSQLNGGSSSAQNNPQNSNNNGFNGYQNITNPSLNNYYTDNNINNTNSQFSNINNANNQFTNENNQLFEKILSDVIHVQPFDARINTNTNETTQLQVQDMPFKLKGLIEPNKNELGLPEGVIAPLTVLAAQPPFSSDIKLINNFAYEANSLVSNYALQVPPNVSFNFNPVV